MRKIKRYEKNYAFESSVALTNLLAEFLEHPRLAYQAYQVGHPDHRHRLVQVGLVDQQGQCRNCNIGRLPAFFAFLFSVLNVMIRAKFAEIK